LPLESLMAKYEEGTKLAKTCQEKAGRGTELKIQKLVQTPGGELKLKPMPMAGGEGE